MKPAIIVIDVQKDFFQGGVLPAKDTPSLVPTLNKVIYWSIKHHILCVFTRDWHPPDHNSFIAQGGIWPPHCIQESRGAEFVDGLYIPRSSLVVDIEKDPGKTNVSYSAFENTSLNQDLNRRQVNRIIVTGIATDYCVKATVLDGLRFGFSVEVLTDLIRPIDVNIGDSEKALKEMSDAGAILHESTEWMSSF